MNNQSLQSRPALAGRLWQASGRAIAEAAWVLALGLVLSRPGLAQEPTPAEPAAEPPAEANPLAEGQKDVAGRFSRLEDLLLRSAELESGENPTRAALLQQAVQLTKQAQLSDLLAQAASNLEQKQFSEAIEQQKNSRENLKRLLELLQSENRGERVREKRDEVRRWIEETDRLLRLQSSLRGRTEGGQDAQQAASDQDKLASKAEDIAQDLKGDGPPQTDAEKIAGDTQPAAGQPAEDGKPEGAPPESPAEDAEPPAADAPKPAESPAGDKPSDSPSSEKPPSPDSKPQSGEPQSGEPQSGEPQSGEPQSGEPQPGQPQPGQPQPGQPQPDTPQAEQKQLSQDPTERARQRIEQAQQRMQEAQKQLEQAERDGAVEKQLQAENDLREAIEELEEILRQLREEEIERALETLETRLRRMLDMQVKVLEETKRLQEISGDQATRQVEIRASSLSRDERKILTEGERAYLLLREEGSSAAFPEAIEQVNADIAKVADRLEAADVGRLTLVIEEEIVSSLEEMVEALVQVQKDNKEKQKQQKQQGQPPPGQPGDQPLVEKLAEIRLIRTLQLRINNRTNALSEMLADPADPVGQVQEGELLQELRGLGERQSSIQQVTRDIVVGTGE